MARGLSFCGVTSLLSWQPFCPQERHPCAGSYMSIETQGLKAGTCKLCGSWRCMMSLRVKGWSVSSSFQYLGLMFSSSKACVMGKVDRMSGRSCWIPSKICSKSMLIFTPFKYPWKSCAGEFNLTWRQRCRISSKLASHKCVFSCANHSVQVNNAQGHRY